MEAHTRRKLFFITERGMREMFSHLVSPIVGTEVADDYDQISYHSFHFLVFTLG